MSACMYACMCVCVRRLFHDIGYTFPSSYKSHCISTCLPTICSPMTITTGFHQLLTVVNTPNQRAEQNRTDREPHSLMPLSSKWMWSGHPTTHCRLWRWRRRRRPPPPPIATTSSWRTIHLTPCTDSILCLILSMLSNHCMTIYCHLYAHSLHIVHIHTILENLCILPLYDDDDDEDKAKNGIATRIASP